MTARGASSTFMLTSTNHPSRDADALLEELLVDAYGDAMASLVNEVSAALDTAEARARGCASTGIHFAV